MAAGSWRSWFDPRPWWRAWLELDDNPVYHYFRAAELQRNNPKGRRKRWLLIAITALLMFAAALYFYWINVGRHSSPVPGYRDMAVILLLTSVPTMLMWYSTTMIRLGTDVMTILAPAGRSWRMQLNDNLLVTPISGIEIIAAVQAIVAERVRWVIPAGATVLWCVYHYMNGTQTLALADPRLLQIVVFTPLAVMLMSACGYLACQLIMLVLLAGGLGTRQRSFAWGISALITLFTIGAAVLTVMVHVLRTEFEARSQPLALLLASLGVLLLLALAMLVAVRSPQLRGTAVLLVPVVAVVVAIGLYAVDSTGSEAVSHSETINAFSILAPLNIIPASNPMLDGRLDAHQPFLYDSGNWREKLLHSEGQEWWRWPQLIITQLLALWLLMNMARLAVSSRRNL